MSFILPVRDDLRGVHSYGAPQVAVPVQLNVNENPFALPGEVIEALTDAVRQVASTLNRYPDRDARVLRSALASYVKSESGVQVEGDLVWAANGSNEVMHHLFLAFGGPGRTAISFHPTYSMYPEYARETFTEYLSFPRCPDFTVDVTAATEQIVEHRPSIVIVASPNNPTGTAVSLADLVILAGVCRETGSMLIVDEAYAEFRRAGTLSALTVLSEFENLVVTRTMSKAFGMAGTRLGYAVASNRAVIDALGVVRLPYHLSTVTQVVATTALSFASTLQAQVDLLRCERDDLQSWLISQGLVVPASDANFIFFGMFDDRDAVWQRVLDEGVLIRATGPPGWLRVSIGSPEENGRFRSALLSAMDQ